MTYPSRWTPPLYGETGRTANDPRRQHTGFSPAGDGPRGRDYNQAEGNPCQGQGNGIAPDLRAARGGAAWVPVVEAAAEGLR